MTEFSYFKNQLYFCSETNAKAGKYAQIHYLIYLIGLSSISGLNKFALGSKD